MYIFKDNIFAEAGYILSSKRVLGFSAPVEYGPFAEREIILDNLEVTDSFITFDQFRWANPGIRSYADAKKYIIQKRYSNDAQIAIMLNREDSEEDALAYQKMQEWREWASLVAHKIMEIIETSNT